MLNSVNYCSSHFLWIPLSYVTQTTYALIYSRSFRLGLRLLSDSRLPLGRNVFWIYAYSFSISFILSELSQQVLCYCSLIHLTVFLGFLTSTNRYVQVMLIFHSKQRCRTAFLKFWMKNKRHLLTPNISTSKYR